MKNIIKLQVILILLVAGIVGCNKTNESNQIEEIPEETIDSTLYTLISGKWQLLTVEEVFVPVPQPTHDYSKYNIVYEFKPNGVLTVSGATDDIERYIGHKTGKHSYSFIDDGNKLGMVGLPFGLQINNFISWYQLSSEELIINDSPLDGYVYFLIKID